MVAMGKPLIGVTCDDTMVAGTPRLQSPFTYTEAVTAAGGLAVLLPFRAEIADIPALLDRLDGVVFSGGDDLDPAAWGESRHAQAAPVNPERERYERALLTEVERRRTPMLGICLGSQLLNVHRGGSLRQFIPDLTRPVELEHRRLEGVDGRHPVEVTAGSLLAEVIGPGRVEANSAHKQAYGRIGRGLRVVATAPDGIPEALEDPTFPLMLAVQWHPERIHREGTQIRLFERLVVEAGRRR
jgi:putative glutamine amidotransferase